jgi:hypothetical protein
MELQLAGKREREKERERKERQTIAVSAAKDEIGTR